MESAIRWYFMGKKIIRHASLWGLVIAVTLPALIGIYSACASSAPGDVKSNTNEKKEQDDIFLFEVRSPQDLVYNGKRQAISYLFTGEGKPDIVYYTSQKDRTEDRGGSRTDPMNAGTYYVRLLRPGKGKTIPAKEFFAILNIKKHPVKIEGVKIQEALFDGNPKRVEASVEPQVPLAYSYYPNAELMEAAKKSASETSPGQNTMVQSFRGYRRIDTPPSEPGTYYVWIYYPGGDNYDEATLDVVFTILPPKK
jgi:hypothetical protein